MTQRTRLEMKKIKWFFFCFQSIFCGAYVLIVYFLTSQLPIAFSFGLFLAASLFTAFIAQSIGLVIAAVMNMQNNKFVATAMSVIFLLTSSSFISYHGNPLFARWISFLSFGKYGFEATSLAIYGWGSNKLPCYEAYCHFRNSQTVLRELDLSDAIIGIDLAALVGIFLMIRILGYISLNLKLRSSKNPLLNWNWINCKQMTQKWIRFI